MVTTSSVSETFVILASRELKVTLVVSLKPVPEIVTDWATDPDGGNILEMVGGGVIFGIMDVGAEDVAFGAGTPELVLTVCNSCGRPSLLPSFRIPALGYAYPDGGFMSS
jgi:hypothetical protein